MVNLLTVFMYIPRKQLTRLKQLVAPNKVAVIYGPRRCGKTTLLKKYLETVKRKYLFVSGEDIIVQNYLGSQSIEKIKDFIGRRRLLVIDEAQKIPAIGANLKLVVDHLPGVSVIATGSSAFDLAREVGEPLTGRKYTVLLFLLAQMEIGQIENRADIDAHLESRLIYGSYPEVVVTGDDQQRKLYLQEIVNSYLYKDILELDGLRHAKKIVQLLQLLAFQIGKEVSYTELGAQLGMSKNTAEKYLDLLEKVFVLHRLTGFSRNLRKEVSKNPRYYFYDNGIRNTLINNMNPIALRDDIGMLWENYIIMERLKRQAYKGPVSNNYFWRTYNQKEIDLVEERGGKLFGYEIKWQGQSLRPPREWAEAYHDSDYTVISRKNYLDFIT